MNGEVNSKNVVRYAPAGNRPENFIVPKDHFPKKVMVFAGIFRGQIFGLRVFEQNTIMNGEMYRDHVISNCLLRIRCLNGGMNYWGIYQ